MRRTATQIPPLDVQSAPLLTRPYLESGSPLAGVLAYVPELLEATLPFVGVVLGPSHLGERLKHIVVLRMSALNGCRYCTRVYRDASDEAGVDPGEAAALCSGTLAAASFSERERAAIAFTEAFSSAPANIAPLAPYFRDDEIVALATIAGTTLFLNRFATTMGLA